MIDVKVFLNKRAKATSDGSYDISNIPESLIKAIDDYINAKFAALINDAPEALDTLGEIANAMKENADVVEELKLVIGTKASKSDLSDYILAEELRPMTADEVAAMITEAKGE